MARLRLAGFPNTGKADFSAEIGSGSTPAELGRISCAGPGDEQGRGTVGQQRLYQLLRQLGVITDRTFEITFLAPGVEAYVCSPSARCSPTGQTQPQDNRAPRPS
jgi:hypothetical protein